MTYQFTIILSGISEPSAEVEDALFKSNCNDALLSFRNAIGYLEFDRIAANFEDAIISAINDVENAGIDVKPLRIEPSDFVTSAEISRRLNRSRESISQLIAGKRGNGNFPKPIAGVTSNTLVWSWFEVVNWFYLNKKIENFDIVSDAKFIRDCNVALASRYTTSSLESVSRIVDKLNEVAHIQQ